MSQLLRIMVLNAQDLFLFMDKHDATALKEMTEVKWQLMSSSIFLNKPMEKCMMLAQTIKESNADVVMITEVGGKESLENFSRFLLEDEFEALSLPSNSDRGIDLGYLVRRDLGLTFELTSHTTHALPAPAYRFSRDVLRLDLKKQDKTQFILLLVHIKSKLNLKGTDFEGRSRRTLEVRGLLEIYQRLEKLGVPVLIGGDFNGHAGEVDTEEEFCPIYEETDLKDIAAMAGIPEQERFSYVYFTRGGRRYLQQIDYLFMSEQYRYLIDATECYFPRYKALGGLPLPIPMKFEQRFLQPSDHYPFVAAVRYP